MRILRISWHADLKFGCGLLNICNGLVQRRVDIGPLRVVYFAKR